ncbi:MAG TPA: hypothetical protein VMW45_02145 [Dehalococcoidia bacterium]|nr:hypothetical protein [Dehalococcoidia bacterium]
MTKQKYVNHCQAVAKPIDKYYLGDYHLLLGQNSYRFFYRRVDYGENQIADC